MKPRVCSALIAGLFLTANLAAAHDGHDHGAAVAKQTQSGVDKAGIDPSVRAQDDFFAHSQGNWLKTVAIPDDRSSWGAFNVANEAVQVQLKTIIEDAEKSANKKAVRTRKKWATCMPASWMKKSVTNWA